MQIRERVDQDKLICEEKTSSIDPLIILVPVGIFVLPSLVLSVLVLVFWKRGRRNLRVTSSQSEASESSSSEDEGAQMPGI